MKLTTAGESHGKGILAILEGVPAGMKVNLEEINARLALRQSGYGRGGRQKIEKDEAEILAGVRNLTTLGSPVALFIRNRDYENWKDAMAPEGADVSLRTLTKVRPGHADLTGLKKYGGEDARNVLERSSARETAARVAAGAFLRPYLRSLGVEITGYVRSVCTVCDEKEYSFEEIHALRDDDFFMIDPEKSAQAKALVEECKAEGDTAGGVIELRVKGLKSGFGSYATYEEKLDARLVCAIMSVQAIKGAEVGLGFGAAAKKGSAVHDEIFYGERGFYRMTNRAGGIEGGMSNGEEIVLRAAMKPIPTLKKGLKTVDYVTREAAIAAPERSDVLAIKTAETVLEDVVVFELARVISERLGGDRMEEVIDRYERLQP